ncbi:MAG TPA: glycosyltransferase family 4 protein [Gammaproteobacteria bacterium]
MRILFCNYEYPPLGGGGGVVNAALAAELATRHDVTVLTSRAAGLPAIEDVDGVRVVRVPVWFRRRRAVANFPSMLAYLATGTLAGRRLVRNETFDVINTHFALPTGPVGHAVSRAAGVPNVLSVHGGDLYDPSKRSSAHSHAVLRAAVRALALGADAVVAQSSDTRDNLRRFFAPELHPHVIPLGIAPPPAVQADRAAHGFVDDDLLLISIGRLIDRKRFDRLVAVLAALRDPRVRLVLVGDGPREQALEDAARRLGVANRVHFAGAVDDRTKFELLAIADVYVSTSEHEGFGLVFLEAMASGLPIVCYDRGGQRDFLQDGRSGYLVPLGDEAAFTERCRRLLGDRQLRREIGRTNRARAQEFFIDRCARRYEELFESVVREHGSRARGRGVGAARIAGSAK